MNDEELIERLRRSPVTPFGFHTAQGQHIQCTDLLRHLRGKRIVCRATLDGAPALVKLYIDRHRARVHAERELTGARAMAERGIATPALLCSGSIADAHFIAYAWIDNAPTALQLYRRARDKERAQLVNALSEIVATHHEAALLQEDLHLGNFLVRDDKIWTVDAAEIKVMRARPSHAAALNNLALLYAQLGPEHENDALGGYAVYARVRGLEEHPSDRHKLTRLVRKRRDERERDYLRKIYRESSAFVAHRDTTRFYVCDRDDHEALKAALTDPERLFRGAELLKNGNTATVALTEIADRLFVVKRYNIKNTAHAVSRALRETRASISWRNGHRLLHYGIDTPRPIALIENRRGPVRRVSYIINEYKPGIAASVYFNRNDVEGAATRAVAESIVDLLLRLRMLRLSHGDMKATNILICPDTIELIDLDSMRKHRRSATAQRASERDIQRFMKNWEHMPAVGELFDSILQRRLKV